MKTNNTLRLLHINFLKIDIAYDDYISKTFYDFMTAYKVPANINLNDALLIVSYINKKVARQHNIDINSHRAIKLTNAELSKYNFEEVKQNQSAISTLELISACGYLGDLPKDPICKSKYFKWFSPNVTRGQISQIYKRCGLDLDEIEKASMSLEK